MTYEDATHSQIGRRAEAWTRQFLERLAAVPTPEGNKRQLTGHFSFDFILSTDDNELYPLECNARAHTAIVLLPVSQIAGCYSPNAKSYLLRPTAKTLPRSWLYNDIIMRYLPAAIPSQRVLGWLHPSLPACIIKNSSIKEYQPSEYLFRRRVDPTLTADDWLPFIILWHVWWPFLLLKRWYRGIKWTRVSRISRCKEVSEIDRYTNSSMLVLEESSKWTQTVHDMHPSLFHAVDISAALQLYMVQSKSRALGRIQADMLVHV